MTFLVDVELTVWCESVQRGCTFSARITDGANARWYAGQGATALEAVAWCLHDFVARGLLDHAPSLARNADAMPGDGLVPAPSSRTRRITPAPPIASNEVASAAADEGACFEQQIPLRPALVLHHESIATSGPTTKRRARGGRS